MKIKEFLELKPKQKKKIYYKKKKKILKKIKKRFRADNREFRYKTKKREITFSSYVPIIATLVVIFMLIVIISLKYEKINIGMPYGIYKKESFWENLISSFHSMLFDYIIYGIILVLIIKKIDEKRRANDYYDFIDDFRGHNSDEMVSARLAAYIRKLNVMGYYDYNLSRCWLKKSSLNELKFINSKFESAHLEKMSLKSCKFNKCKFEGNYAVSIKIKSCMFLDTKIINFNGNNAKISDVKFRNCDLRGTDLSNSVIKSVSFFECDLKDVKLENAVLENVNFLTAKNINIDLFLSCKSISKSCKIEEKIKRKLEDEHLLA